MIVDGTRYELKAAERAEASVAGVLEAISKGDNSTYIVKGTKTTLPNGQAGILVESIAKMQAHPAY